MYLILNIFVEIEYFFVKLGMFDLFILCVKII